MARIHRLHLQNPTLIAIKINKNASYSKDDDANPLQITIGRHKIIGGNR